MKSIYDVVEKLERQIQNATRNEDRQATRRLEYEEESKEWWLATMRMFAWKEARDQLNIIYEDAHADYEEDEVRNDYPPIKLGI